MMTERGRSGDEAFVLGTSSSTPPTVECILRDQLLARTYFTQAQKFSKPVLESKLSLLQEALLLLRYSGSSGGGNRSIDRFNMLTHARVGHYFA